MPTPPETLIAAPHSEMYARVYAHEKVLQEMGAFAWIQYKGTNICVDIHCSCLQGSPAHYDGDFCYAVRCPGCGTVYALEQTVRLVPLTPEDQAHFDVKEAFQ